MTSSRPAGTAATECRHRWARSTYLLDTDVVSELRPRRLPTSAVTAAASPLLRPGSAPIPSIYSSVSCDAVPTGSANGIALFRGSLDRRGHLPLGSDLGRSPHTPGAGRPAHPSMRDTPSWEGLLHRNLGGAPAGGLRVQQELDGIGLVEHAHRVYEQPYDLAVVFQPPGIAFLVGRGEALLPKPLQHLEHVPLVVIRHDHLSAGHGPTPSVLGSKWVARVNHYL